MRRLALFPLVLAATLLTVAVLPGRENERREPPFIHMVPNCNLQVGVPGQTLARRVCVVTRPGESLTFTSPDMGAFGPDRSSRVVVIGDRLGLAGVDFHLGPNLGGYTVVASPTNWGEPEIVYHFRAISPDQFDTRARRFGLTSIDSAEEEILQ
jgi:hypothetical protein